MREATSRQHWAIYVGTGYDSRDTEIDIEQASKIISLSREGGLDKATALLEAAGAVKKKDAKQEKPAPKKKLSGKDRYEAIQEEAHAAGLKAFNECIPEPIYAVQHKNVLDDSSEIVQVWEGKQGICGHVHATFDGRSAFARWLVKSRNGFRSTNGGVVTLCQPKTVSYEKKDAYMVAYLETLAKYGIRPKSVFRKVD